MALFSPFPLVFPNFLPIFAVNLSAVRTSSLNCTIKWITHQGGCSERASLFSFSYMKTATEITMQIEKLRKRGMLLENEALAKDFLLNVGYYRLGFYWFHFEQKELQDRQHPHNLRRGLDLKILSNSTSLIRTCAASLCVTLMTLNLHSKHVLSTSFPMLISPILPGLWTHKWSMSTSENTSRRYTLR